MTLFLDKIAAHISESRKAALRTISIIVVFIPAVYFNLLRLALESYSNTVFVCNSVTWQQVKMQMP